MICRIWHGWTSPQHADSYERLLQTEIFEGIAARNIEGYRGIELLRRPAEGSVEFVTLMWFDSLQAVRVFAGADADQAVVPASARALLDRYDARSAHFEVRQARQAPQRAVARALAAFRLVLGMMLLWGGVSTLLGAAADHHALVIGGVEAAGAVAFLLPRTVALGAALLLVAIGVAFLVHAARGQFRPDLVVYAAGVFLVALNVGAGFTRVISREVR